MLYIMAQPVKQRKGEPGIGTLEHRTEQVDVGEGLPSSGFRYCKVGGSWWQNNVLPQPYFSFWGKEFLEATNPPR